MTLIPRKRCPKCQVVFEGPEVPDLYSCDVCGNGYLSLMEDRDTEKEKGAPLPRSGGHTITHARDSF